jgi:AcrR family transcriptional regulator
MEERTVREQILSIAEEKFFTQGFSKVSIEELASELGISKKTLYKNFESKEALLSQLMERKMAAAQIRVEAILAQCEPLPEKIKQLGEFIGTFLQKLSPIFLKDLSKNVPDLWKRIDEFRTKRLQESFKKIWREGLEQGVVRDDVPEDIMTLALVGALRSVINPEVLSQHSFSSKEALEAVFKIVFQGTLTENGKLRLAETTRKEIG